VAPAEWLYALLWVAPLHEADFPAYNAHLRLASLPLVEEQVPKRPLHEAPLPEYNAHLRLAFLPLVEERVPATTDDGKASVV
jgi:hypothetical protein